MGVSADDIQLYMDMFARHNEISRTVEEMPGGVRTTTESNSPDLAAQLETHVSSMYAHLGDGADVHEPDPADPLPQRERVPSPTHSYPAGVIAEETSDDPNLTEVIRAHAREVTGFVTEGMPAMMDGMMGPGGIMSPGRP